MNQGVWIVPRVIGDPTLDTNLFGSTDCGAPAPQSGCIGRRARVENCLTTGTAVVVTQLVTTGPLSPEAVEGIGGRTHPRVTSVEPHEWRMVIDLSTCVGCSYCVWACQAVNDVPEDDMRWNVGFAERTENGVEFYMTRPCLHCKEAPCVKVCPVGATWIREDGVVAMDYERCIGCRYCEVACPYDARRFNWKTNEAENPYQPMGTARSRAARQRCGREMHLLRPSH